MVGLTEEVAHFLLAGLGADALDVDSVGHDEGSDDMCWMREYGVLCVEGVCEGLYQVGLRKLCARE